MCATEHKDRTASLSSTRISFKLTRHCCNREAYACCAGGRGRSCVRATNDAINDLDTVACAPCGLIRLLNRTDRSVFQAHGSFVTTGCLDFPFDLVADDSAANRTDHCHGFLAVSATDLVTEQTADHCTACCSDAAAFGSCANFPGRFNHAAIGAGG